MKTISKIFLMVLLISANSIYAQKGANGRLQKIKSLKVSFITNELDLTTTEAAKFWPIYNANEDKQKMLRSQRVAKLDLSKVTDLEAHKLLLQLENNEEQLFQLRKKFMADLKQVLPAIKIIKLKQAEENFNRTMLRQYRGRPQKK